MTPTLLQPSAGAPSGSTGTVVPFADLRVQYESMQAEILDALRDVAESGIYTLGSHVADFEKAFAAYVGAQHCIGVNSGTSALHLALICAGVGPGDEVI